MTYNRRNKCGIEENGGNLVTAKNMPKEQFLRRERDIRNKGDSWHMLSGGGNSSITPEYKGKDNNGEDRKKSERRI